jgi:thiamine transport system substrate-binding protein
VTHRHSAIVALILLLAACANANPVPTGGPSASPNPTASATAGSGQEVTLLTHDSFAVSDEVLAAFTAQTGATIRVLRAGDAGTVVNQAILTRDNPIADVLYGVDNTFLTRAFDEGIFEPYQSPSLPLVPVGMRLDARQRVTPVDYGDVCLNYDKAAFGPGTTPPQALEDLTKPEFRSKLVVEDPASSSPGLAFMLATIARFGETGDYTWLDYWADLRANDVLVTSGWEEAYYESFSGGAGEGDRPVVVSYATSPAAEVFYADPPTTEAPTGVVLDSCFRQVEFVGVLAGAREPELARKVVDFMLSADFQADIPLSMFVFPAVPSTELPEVFVAHAPQVPGALTMTPEQIGADRERWINEWTAAR